VTSPLSPSQPAPVVLVAVPDLLWSDLPAMPALRSLAASAATGALVVKTAGYSTTCVAGLLAVSAGNRTSGSGSGCSVGRPALASLRESNRRSRFDASVGALGDALRMADITAAATGPATVMLADRRGALPAGAPGSTPDVTGIVLPGLYDVRGPARAAAAAGVDARLRGIIASLPAAARLVVAGTSDGAAGRRHLHVLVIHGPGWPHRALTSPLTGRAPYVQLIDLGPTVLSMLGVPAPSGMVGRPVRVSGAAAPLPGQYVDADRHAQLAPRLALRGTLTWVTFGLLVLTGLIGWNNRRGSAAVHRLARLAAPLAAVSFLVNALPWWRWGRLSFFGLLLAGAALVALVTTGARRRSTAAAVLVPTAFGAAVLVIDQLTGGGLQLSAPLGDDPLTAGRFTGLGNLSFAVLAASALPAAAVLAARFRRPAAVAVAAVVCLVAVVVDVAPALGDDFGGALSLVPAAAVLIALVAGVRLSVWRVLAVAGLTVVVAVGLALGDYSRPASRQTHVGRFAGQVLHGGAGTVLRRKADATLGTFGFNAATVLIVVTALLAWWFRERWPGALRRVPGLGTGVTAAGIAAVVGTVLNDAGTVVAAMVITVVAPVCIGALDPASGLPGRRSPLPPSPDPTAGADRGDPLTA
jgi:hypothetical protein